MITLLFSLVAVAGIPEDGIWRQDCRAAYQREERLFQDKIHFVETNFLDTKCLQPGLEIKSEGAIAWGAPVSSPADAFEADYEFEKIFVTVKSDTYKNYFNAKKVCGLEEWEIGQSVEVTGKHCGLFRAPDAGDKRYGIYKVEAGLLYFGKLTRERNASTPELRPRELDPSPYRRLP